MSETAERTDPALWEEVKQEVTAGSKGGRPGQWSARKAQLAVAQYKKRGGGYRGAHDPDNALHRWTKEDWGTRSGEESGKTGERYLPKAAREELSDDEYRRTTARKRDNTRKGRQFSAQPADIARKTRRHHDHRTRAALYEQARKRDIPGRSKMTRDQLIAALDG